MHIERRIHETGDVEIRATGDDSLPTLRGHAATFDEPYRVWDFEEQIARGAFRDAINEDDVRALLNHHPDNLLGRSTAGTLRLSEDEKGLYVEIDPPDTRLARDLVTLVERGDLSQMSFGFLVVEETWTAREDEPDLRTISKVQLFDVSPVTYPANANTDLSARELPDSSLELRQAVHGPPARPGVPTKLVRARVRHLELRERGLTS